MLYAFPETLFVVILTFISQLLLKQFTREALTHEIFAYMSERKWRAEEQTDKGSGSNAGVRLEKSSGQLDRVDPRDHRDVYNNFVLGTPREKGFYNWPVSFASEVRPCSDNFEHNSSNIGIFEKDLKRDCLTHSHSEFPRKVSSAIFILLKKP